MSGSDGTTRSAGTVVATAHGVGARIRALRYERCMTQAELGRGRFSVSYISAVERGAVRPSLQALEHLANTLQVSMAHLLAGTPETSSRRRRTTVSPPTSACWDLAHAQVTLAQGHPDETLTILNGLNTQALEPAEQIQRHHLIAECHLALGQHEAARASAAQGVLKAEAVGDRGAVAYLLVLQARAYRSLASADLALDLLERALELFANAPYGDPIAELDATLLAYEIARQLDHHEQAATLLKCAQRLAATLSAPPRLATLALAQTQQAVEADDSIVAERFLAQVEAALAHETACAAQERIQETIDQIQHERTHAPVGGTYALSGWCR